MGHRRTQDVTIFSASAVKPIVSLLWLFCR